ncbi:MAG: YraN family protein [Alcaligenaceae bacterium]|nr:YraN family protein [Alcaligenaceae bacterium]
MAPSYTTSTSIFELALAKQHKISCKTTAYRSSSAKPFYDHKLSPKQKKGLQAEELAIEYLLLQGLQFISRNLSCRFGEIDCIMADKSTLVFIEIKSRKNKQFGGAAGSISAAKQRRLRASAAFFLPLLSRQYFSGKTPLCRFDAVCITNGQIEWIRHAF